MQQKAACACRSLSRARRFKSRSGNGCWRFLTVRRSHTANWRTRSIDLERSAQVIAEVDPDVVTLQEVDVGCGRSGGINQAAWLGERLGMTPVFGAFMDYDGGHYGMAVLSRLPVLDHENILPIHGVHDDASVPFFAMKFVEGGTLQDWLEDEPLPVPHAKGPRTVVLISLDTLRPDRLGLYGNTAGPLEVSPVLDAFAASEAVVFDQALAASPW